DRLRGMVDRGARVAGYIAYEAGHALEPRLAALNAPPRAGAAPLLWFAAFADVELLSRDEVGVMLPDPDGAWLSAPEPCWDAARYREAVAHAKAYIASGDIYQANISMEAE